jgi:crotonobetainyl-CoA:carnitine CoA-transferase CaiB-like acyl-CoA transferase
MTGQNPQRLGSAHPQIVPYQAFETSDGYFMLAVGNDQQFQRFCEASGHGEVWQEAKFQTNAGRVEHRQEVIATLSAITKEQSTSYWLECCKTASVPASPINTLTDVFEDPQVKSRRLIEHHLHPTLGELPMIASPFKASATTVASPPPLLGQHTFEVLGKVLGLSQQDLDRLEQEGVIKGIAKP